MRKLGTTNSVEHGVEDFLRAVETAVYCRESDHTGRREDQEGQARALGTGFPGMCLLQVLKRVDGENQLHDGEGEQDAEEDSITECLSAIAIPRLEKSRLDLLTVHPRSSSPSHWYQTRCFWHPLSLWFY